MELKHSYTDYKNMAEAVAVRLGEIPKCAVVLGSGLGFIKDRLTDCRSMRYDEIPGFTLPGNPNHSGVLSAGRLTGIPVLLLSGRAHCYEGYDMARVAGYVRMLALLKVKKLVLTNAAGSLRPEMNPGSFMLISDHIKLCAESPLTGPHMPEFGKRFVDLTRCYDPELRAAAKRAANTAGVVLREGVYMYFAGPQYETPAEIRAAKALGADAVGMSTVPEAIMARSVGIRLLAVSCITNLAAGLSDWEISDAHVAETAQKTAGEFERLLSGILENIHTI
ncbi:MAG TPA: purine-nucleoside phosphorylase [Ruminococcaceae bacterium]|nr:purine-nucleoside phosphorylase [Oscillospiraceae bacterium]